MDNWSDIRRRARETRGLLGPAYADTSAVRVIERLAETWELDVVAVARDHPLLRGARAAWREEYGLVAVDVALAGPERSFAVAHELGHRVCHPGGCACGDGDVDPADLPAALPLGEGRVWGYNPRAAREREANVFAAELLMPPPALRSRFLAGASYDRLATAYGVSTASMLNGLTAALLGGVADENAEFEAGPEPSAPGVPLDPSQRRAARTGQLRVLVDAGPGTGKTRTLVARIAYLVETAGIEPRHILAVTFSNRAAEELRGRLRRIVPAATDVTVATFHGFALELLRRFAPQAGLPDDFRVVDDLDAAFLLERRLPSLELKHYARLTRPGLYLPALLDACSRMRDELQSPDDLAAGWDADTAGQSDDDEERERREETVRVLRAYEQMLDQYGLVDYGGLIARAVLLLQTDPSVAAAVRGDLRHVLVDEYQDVNRAGAVLLRTLVSGGAHLWAVGDVRQSIYRFRGAAPRNVEAFEQDFPGSVRLALERNYRAAPSLVRLAGSAADAVTGTPAAWSAVRGEPRDGGAVLAIAPDKPSELAGIVADVARSIAAGRRPEDHAVLCRTHRQASEAAAAFVAAGLPTSYLGAFLLRREIKDMLALLEFCHGGDGAALLRLTTWPDYTLEPEEAEAVLRAARERGLPFPSALHDAVVLDATSPRGRPALQRLARHVEAIRYYPDPAAVLTHYLFGDARYLRDLLRAATPASRQAAAALFQLVVLARGFTARPVLDRVDADDATGAFLRHARRLLAEGEMGVALAAAPVAGAVNVLTVHGAKGLEFPVVYVPNLSQGRFPPRARGGVSVALPPALASDAAADGDDERSLFFVAVSRAQDRLVLSRAERYGSRRHGESGLLAALRSAHPLTAVIWPQVDITEGDASAEGAGVGKPVVTDQDISSALRCPRQHRYRVDLGLRGDDTERGYRLYARLVRAAVGRLRAAWGTAEWPAWEAARGALVEEWGARWPVDDALSGWYRTAALAALERVYRDMAERGIADTARFDERHSVAVDGRSVSVRVDAIEEIDGVQSLILERATRRSDDERSVGVGLYGAVAQDLAPGDPLPVLIRYLDSGDMRAIAQPLRVLDRHRAGIARAADLLAGQFFPPLPREAEECTMCPLVFICPG